MKKNFILLSVIFILAVLFRLGASTLLPRHEGPDAPAYKYVAENIISYIQGAPIEDKEQFLKVAGRRGWLYPFFIAVLFALFGHHNFIVSGFQILLDGFSCVLLYLMGRKVFSRRIALLAAFLAATYPGFIFYSKFISQETTITFLLVLLVYVVISIGENPTWKNHLVAGFFLGLITFYRPSYQFFFILFLPFLAYYLKRCNQGKWRVLLMSFTTGLMIVILGWMAFSYTVNKQVVLYKSSMWAFYETLRNDGWVTDDYFLLVDDDLRKQLLAMEYPPPPKGTLLNFEDTLPASVYLRLGLNWIKNHPFESSTQVLKRIYRMWFYIETWPAGWHDGSTGVQLFYHRLLVVSALIGLSLSLSQWRSLWMVYLLIGYANAHILIVGIPRYSVPLMPFIILLASYALIYLIERFKSIFLPIHWKGVVCVGGFLVSSLIFYLPFPTSIGTLLSLFPVLLPEHAYYVIMFAGNVQFLIIGLVIYRYLRHEGRKKAFAKAIVFVVLTLPFLNTTLITNRTWHEWWCTLQDRDASVVHKIYPPQDLDISPSTQADLFIDMMSGTGKDYTFVVKVNGRKVKSYTGGLKSDRDKFKNRFTGLYVHFFFNTYQLRPEDLRQWYRIPLDSKLLKTNDPIEIACYLEGNPDGKDNYVYLFGDYLTERLKNDNSFEGPTIPQTNQDTSLYKILPYEGDSRFETRLNLQSESRESYFCERDSCQEEDLSGFRGVQQGSYRIYIRLLDERTQRFL